MIIFWLNMLVAMILSQLPIYRYNILRITRFWQMILYLFAEISSTLKIIDTRI